MASTDARSLPSTNNIPPDLHNALINSQGRHPNLVESSDGLSSDLLPDTYEDQYVTLGDEPTDIYVGYLKDLGLDYGWGPSSIIETLLEYFSVYTGLPWAACIIFTSMTIRAFVIKLYINSSDTSARMKAIKSITDPIDERIRTARANQDQAKFQSAGAERKRVMSAAGIKMRTIFYPVMVQIPMGFGMFRVMRGMTGLPVPGLETGGYLWFQDLTVPDPIFVLPLMTAACFYTTFKVSRLPFILEISLDANLSVANSLVAKLAARLVV